MPAALTGLHTRNTPSLLTLSQDNFLVPRPVYLESGVYYTCRGTPPLALNQLRSSAQADTPPSIPKNRIQELDLLAHEAKIPRGIETSQIPACSDFEMQKHADLDAGSKWKETSVPQQLFSRAKLEPPTNTTDFPSSLGQNQRNRSVSLGTSAPCCPCCEGGRPLQGVTLRGWR